MSAFDGLRIIDFSTGVAGPYAAMYFTDHGADVVKVEPPEGDPYRAAPGFQTFNRGKRSVILDLGTAEGREAAHALVRTADAVIVDLTQRRARAIGIDDETLRREQPNLLYLAMPPYGEHGPLVDRPESPQLLHALNGMTEGQETYSGDPACVVLPLGAYGTALLAAVALAAGLRARTRWGIGQMLEVSGLAGSLALQLGSLIATRDIPVREKQPSPRGGRGHIPAYRMYAGSDGLFFYLGCATTDFYIKMMTAIGREDLLADERLGTNPLGHNTAIAEEILGPALEDVFRTKPRDHWISFFREVDVPAQPLQTRDEFRGSDLARRNAMSVVVQHPELGEVEMMGVPLVLEAAPGEVRGRAPLLGEHTREVLSERLPASAAAPATSEAPGAHLLSGLRVLDLSVVIAGPSSTRHLAMLGADVIKIEPLGGELFRYIGLGFLGWNQGKRAIALDLRTPGGREIMHRLVATADVMVENYRPGVPNRLGVDYETLRAINPRLVYVTQPGFGDDESMSSVPMFDPLAQALTGAIDAQGGGEPVRFTVSITDTMQALVAAFGACAALAMRERTGEGQRVRTSLTRTGAVYQAAEFTRYQGVEHIRGGRDFAGPSAGERWYRCSDGEALWVEATTEAQRAALVTATGVSVAPEDCAQGATSPAASVLASAFATLPLGTWIERLDAADVPCNPIVKRHEILGHPATLANDLVVTEHHEAWGETVNVGAVIHASHTPVQIPGRAPLLSEHAAELMAELGYSEADVASLVEAGAIRVPTSATM